MDNITLTEEQLWELRKFIRKRGINELDVINEVLDHFACKTEEIMNSNHRLSFEQAMKQAHLSFGINGFRPMVNNYEKHLDKIVWAEFRTNFKKVLFSPKMVLGIFLSVITYLSLSFFENKVQGNWFFDLKLIGLLTITIFFLGMQLFYFFFAKNALADYSTEPKKLRLWQKKVLGLPFANNLLILFLLIPCVRQSTAIYFMIFCSAMSFLGAIITMAKRETIKRLAQIFEYAY